ncbi:hypothetical protein ECC02_007726 [Trypanosoma cruzi]|uniref:Endonuclease/exonuclease/phosphatase domain-containing protein n=1 Tax=Trypanosoma cruzi TaxID=5693 RepID=A0A7J6XZ70_TRYCR|nr:hypothetical protein ECC02_007726 [Trypanosoma cruzi]
MYVVNLCNLPTAMAHAVHLASTIRLPGSAAPIAGDLNLHHELRDGRSPSTTAGENLAATPSGMEIELSDDPAQATRISGRHVLFPDVTAQCVLRVSHWTSTSLDSYQHLSSHTAGTEDGIPRQAGMLPRRKHAAFAMCAADWNDSTTAFHAPLATATTWLEMHRSTIQAARSDIPCGSRVIPTGMWTDGMERAESTAAAACNAHTASPGGSLPRAEVLRKREDCNHALRGGFSMLLEVRAKQLGALSSPGL